MDNKNLDARLAAAFRLKCRSHSGRQEVISSVSLTFTHASVFVAFPRQIKLKVVRFATEKTT